ncbi:neurofilament heavy polypeptide-like [Passer domesticus]|uniref:neurofilament heavy polypeptide-like n=1 Tax=Passer domesticus TaxID=48849 RepID=UPI0030FEC9B2
MAFSSRFAFWEQKVKDEDKSLAVKRPVKEDGASESPKDAASAPPKAEPPKPEPVKSPEPAKSPEPPPGRGKSPEPVLNGAAENGLEGAAPEAQGDDGQGLSRRKVVRVVRKVVRKVLPGEDAGSAKEPGRDAKSPEPVPPPRKEEAGRAAVPAPPAPPPPPSVVPSAPAKPEPKDEISEGLKTLMAKGKSKEHRPRLRPGDRQKSPEPAAGDTKLSPSPGAEAKPEPPVSGGKAEPAKASALKPTALERHKKLQTSEKRPTPVKNAPAAPQQAAPGPASPGPTHVLSPSEEAQLRLERIFTTSVIPEVLVLACRLPRDGEAWAACGCPRLPCALHTVTVPLCLAANPMVHLWVTLAAGNG